VIEGIKFEVFNLCVVDEEGERDHFSELIILCLHIIGGGREGREMGKNLFSFNVIPL
jgi:hypothetical protein